MSTVAIRKTTYDGLTQFHQQLIKNAWADLALGDPAYFHSESGAAWCVWDDPSIRLEQAALIGSIASNWQLFPTDFPLPNDPQERQQAIVAQLGANLVQPDQIAYSGADDFQETLNAQGAPSTYVVLSGVPATWVAFDPFAG